MNIRIEHYNKNHEDEICKMIFDYWNELDFGIDYELYQIREYIKVISENIKKGKKEIWWVLKNNIKAGFIIFSIENSWPDISNKKGKIAELFIKKDFRRQRLGSFLVNNVINYLSSNHIEKIELEVLTNNEKAIEFWKKKNFNIDKYLLKKKLS